jgi:hypothetical protein
VAGLAEVGLRDGEALQTAIAVAVANEFGIDIAPSPLVEAEVDRATRLMSEKYRSASWTERPLDAAALNTTRTR